MWKWAEEKVFFANKGVKEFLRDFKLDLFKVSNIDNEK